MRPSQILRSGGDGEIGKYGKYLGGWGNFGEFSSYLPAIPIFPAIEASRRDTSTIEYSYHTKAWSFWKPAELKS
ncbi:hypothetical protein LOCC1_G001231 [Lachnellula occidentalis]|uniref:Uncharacterized protein n=1 Tax=Lachnellula occidentalis TaxID=215460 RepID=A0A8H8S5P0_9HELO|nr:hypothetical protein LOCC1_G001231 [Lachnellula occidentalis]